MHTAPVNVCVWHTKSSCQKTFLTHYFLSLSETFSACPFNFSWVRKCLYPPWIIISVSFSLTIFFFYLPFQCRFVGAEDVIFLTCFLLGLLEYTCFHYFCLWWKLKGFKEMETSSKSLWWSIKPPVGSRNQVGVSEDVITLPPAERDSWIKWVASWDGECLKMPLSPT